MDENHLYRTATVASAWPKCAKCEQPVEFLSTFPLSEMSGDLIVVAECHGAREETRLEDALFLGGVRIAGGYAFIDPETSVPATVH